LVPDTEDKNGLCENQVPDDIVAEEEIPDSLGFRCVLDRAAKCRK
jgi:hypothetical protein